MTRSAKTSTLLLALVVVVATSGLVYHHFVEPYGYADVPTVDAAVALSTAFKTADHLKFLSWDGKWKGTDIDTALVLSANGKATITNYGDAMDSADGTYTTDGSLVIVNVDFDKLVGMQGREDWPALRLKRDGADLVLIPNRRTASLNYHGSTAWPLRQTK